LPGTVYSRGEASVLEESISISVARRWRRNFGSPLPWRGKCLQPETFWPALPFSLQFERFLRCRAAYVSQLLGSFPRKLIFPCVLCCLISLLPYSLFLITLCFTWDHCKLHLDFTTITARTETSDECRAQEVERCLSDLASTSTTDSVTPFDETHN
jgi:hypothetical protein